jgi:hypothetical protein
MAKKRKKDEENFQIALSTYVMLQYPKVVFNSDSSGLRLTIGQASRIKQMRSTHKHLDMFFAEPKGDYHGLYLELKATSDSPFLKDGTISIKKHVQEQLAQIMIMRKKGYAAYFAVGLDQAKVIIDRYMEYGIITKPGESIREL